MKNSIKRERRTKSEIHRLLNLQAESTHITVTEFCRINNIQKASFYNWRNKYGDGVAGPAQFMPLHLDEAVSDGELFAEIELGPKIKVKLFHRVDAVYFKALLK